MAPPLKEDPALASNSFILDTVETQKKILLEQGGFVIPEVYAGVKDCQSSQGCLEMLIPVSGKCSTISALCLSINRHEIQE